MLPRNQGKLDLPQVARSSVRSKICACVTFIFYKRPSLRCYMFLNMHHSHWGLNGNLAFTLTFTKKTTYEIDRR